MSGPALTILQGDALTMLRGLPDESVQCCVTSPPYWGLRDYGHAGQIGLEDTPAQYVERMVEVFREVRRVLKKDGTLWLNLGDSYAGSGRGKGDTKTTNKGNPHSRATHGQKMGSADGDEGHTKYVPPPKGSCLPAGMHETARAEGAEGAVGRAWVKPPGGFKCKDLIGIPWRVAFALQADGWFLRSKIPWLKRNCMPESITDRPTTAVEEVFLLSKSERYFYDYESIKLNSTEASMMRLAQDTDAQDGSDRANGGAKTNGTMKAVGQKPPHGSVEARKARARAGTKSFPDAERNGIRGGKNEQSGQRRYEGFNERWDQSEAVSTRNFRNSDLFFKTWQGLITNEDGDPLAFVVNPQPYREAHFATFPKKLVEPMIKAGCPTGGVVLDPFGGSGTTGQVALELGRSAILCELNPAYCELIRQRCNVTPGLALA